MYNALLFDLDNTLIDRDDAFRKCVETTFGDLVVRLELMRLDQGGRGDREQLFNYWSQQSETEFDQAAFASLIAEQIQPNRQLLSLLRDLSQVKKLGIITNGSGATQRRKLKAAGLDDVFSAENIFISGELAVSKPGPAIFLLASQALGENPEHCLYIGDHEADDLLGANRAGMHCRLVPNPLNAESLSDLLKEEQLT